MKRWVAIKVMLAQQDENALERFKNEAIVAGGLNHPNLVTVYELGDYKGRPYIVMEYLEGRDLSHYLTTEEVLPLFKKIDILVQAARGLERAHRQQVIHRDIKPANVMLLKDGSVKVMDFGVARLTHEVPNSKRNTASGMVVGSLLWMAPEIFSGQDADVQSDIWSFGVMAFELISGEHPFQPRSAKTASTAAQLVFQITQAQPPQLLGLGVPGIPADLAEVVRKCMIRDRAERYQSLRDVILDLEPILSQQRRLEAMNLVAQADHTATLGQLDRAMDLVTEALEFDNESQPARTLRERLQRELRRKSWRDRVEMLIGQADQDVAANRLDEAIQKFRAALELDSESVIARTRLEELQARLSRKKQVEQLAALAGKHLASGDVDAAARLLEQGFALEPNDSQLVQVQQLLESERMRREKRLRLEGELSHARERLEHHEPGEALRIVSRAKELAAGEPGLDSLLFALEEIRRQSERMEAVRQSFVLAQALQRNRDWAGVISTLEPVADAAGASWPEVTELLATARRETNLASQHSGPETIESIRQRILTLAVSGDTEGALQVVETALHTHPDDPTLLELRAKVAGRTLQFERRSQDLDGRVSELNQAISRQDWDRAGSLLAGIERDFPGNQAAPEWRGKLAAARRRHQMQVRRAGIDTAMQLHQWDRAAQELLEFRRDYPRAEGIDHLAGQIQAGARASVLRGQVREMETFIESRDWPSAHALLLVLQQQHPGEAVVDHLRRRYEEELFTDQVTRRARTLIDEGDLEAARQELLNGLAVLRVPPIEELLAQVDASLSASASSEAADPRLHASPWHAPDAPPQPPRPDPSSSGSVLWIGGGIAVLLIGLLVGYFAFWRKPAIPLTASGPPPIVATAGSEVRAQLQASGGAGPPYRWTIARGALPDGLELSSATGELAGTSRHAGVFRVEARVTDANGETQQVAIDITLQQPPPPPPPVPLTKPVADAAPKPPARAGNLVWTGNLASGEIITITGLGVSAGALSGAPLPGGFAVHVIVQVPGGVTVIHQPAPDTDWRSFQIRNDSSHIIGRIQILWMLR